ncbi:HNH endonuclease [Methylobacterium pseudosasicola]|uniref:HNH endonuclease n=1 Tax=Methylobacterium pseudosasicola TaxID=582667 RepID=UPI00111418B5
MGRPKGSAPSRIEARRRARDLPTLTAADRSRLWTYIDRREPYECWPWVGAGNGTGYGRIRVQGRLYLPHRLVCADASGPLADLPQHHGTVVRHSCDNPICCNPAHLITGTQRQNVEDTVNRSRFAKGWLPGRFQRKQGANDE